MSSSILLGIKHLQECNNYMIYPVDHPNVSFETIVTLIESHNRKKNYYIPTYKNKGGHPIIIPNIIVKEIYSKLGLPLNILLKNYESVRVAVQDKEILRNINYKKEIITNSKKEKE
ncbi:MAG: NTP transferase domain-containing protein, partial [Candidatus Cloacimonadota bacterium]|nr:NTP transferase domain-containing protein [Candidatus Cloacimonadota bacterium]